MRRTECDRALERLSAYLEDPESRRGEGEAALSHMNVCPDCRRSAAYLAEALTAKHEDRMTCQQCQKRMPDYLQAEQDGQADQAQWWQVALHVRTCPVCAAVYAELTDLLALANRERGVEPPRYPAPRLQFLRGNPARPKQPMKIPWRLDQLGRLVIELTADVLRGLQTPARQPAYATAGRKSNATSAVLWELPLVNTVEDLDVKITAQQIRGTSDRCTVIVEVAIPSRGGWPHLAGTEVMLQRHERHLATRMTDAFGKAVFQEIATDDIPQLIVTIKPGEKPKE